MSTLKPLYLGYNDPELNTKAPTNFSVAVYCASSPNVSEEWKVIAAQIATVLHKHGITLVNGGGTGLMEIASKTMLSLGGNVVVSTLDSFSSDKDYYTNHLNGTFTRYTADSMPKRRVLLGLQSHLCISLVGSTGTLEELAEQLAATKLGWQSKRVLVYNLNGFWDGMIMQLNAFAKAGAMTENDAKLLESVISIDQFEKIIIEEKEKWMNLQQNQEEVECKQ